MHLVKTLPFFGILAVSLVAVGCGGGGGGGNSGGGTPPPVVGTQLKTLTPVFFRYDQSGTLTTTAGGTQPLTATSRRTVDVRAEATAGQFVYDSTDALIVDENQPSTALNFDVQVTQQPDHSLVIRSVDLGDGIRQVTSANRIFLPATFRENTTSTPQSLTLSDGTTATYTFNIAGRESVVVPTLGTFNTYVVNSSITLANNNKRVGTYNYAPELGIYVKATETVTRPNGTVAVVTSTLASAN